MVPLEVTETELAFDLHLVVMLAHLMFLIIKPLLIVKEASEAKVAQMLYLDHMGRPKCSPLAVTLHKHACSAQKPLKPR